MADGVKRASNPQKKLNRQQSWNRAQIKKKRNRERNEAQHKENVAYLKSAGLQYGTKSMRPSKIVFKDKKANRLALA